ncbi:MAG: hypothetical protein IT578_10615 [Verrucomicrobiae bacterium]|nr:hypothetical protein [Verrucomicrobiae bacterium]
MNSLPPTSEGAPRRIGLCTWMVSAVLLSLVVHVGIWCWLQEIYLPYRPLPSNEKLLLRKFHVKRVEISARWLQPPPPPPPRPSEAISPDRASLPPSAEPRVFARMLDAAPPSSPTLPSGSPPLPEEKTRIALGAESLQTPELFSRSDFEKALARSSLQAPKGVGSGAGAGKPSGDVPGAAVAPKPSTGEADLPTSTRLGPSRGPETGDPGRSTGWSRLDDFLFGAPGGTGPAETPRPALKASTRAAPPSLLDDPPVEAPKYDSLNEFLDVRLFTQERPGRDGAREGWFLVRITAKTGKELEVFPRDVTCVLDISSSIGGGRLAAFRQGLLDSLDQLNPDDRVRLYAFRDRLSAFRDGWVSAARLPRSEVRDWLNALRSSGTTDFYDALLPLVGASSGKSRMAIGFILSDGIPTVGMVDSTQIINRLSEKNDNAVSLFSFSAGPDVNRFLLDLLAYRNQGWLRHASRAADAAGEFSRLARQVRYPLFLNLRFRFAGVDGAQVFPQNLPNLYRDSPLLLFGRYAPGRTEALSLQVLGDSLRGTKELLVRLPIPEKPTGPDSIAATWARQKIYDLLSRMTDSPENQEKLLDQVRALADEYQVETPYR